MTKQEIINKLVSPQNFKDVVEICLKEDLVISHEYCFPDVVVYINETEYHQKETGEFKDCGGWISVNIKTAKFEVDGVIMSGIRNFFINYNKITKFILKGNIIMKVIPHINNGTEHWYSSEDYDHFEISYDCHSFSGYAYESKNDKRYYIEGDRFDMDDYQKECREFKLSRILDENLDYDTYRLEKKKKRLKKIKEKIKKPEYKSDGWITFNSSDDYSFSQLA